MQKLVAIFFCLLIGKYTLAQNPIPDLSKTKTVDEKIKLLKSACDSLADIENYKGLKTVARFAIQTTPPSDFANLSLFYHYLGNSLENLTNRDSAIYYFQQSLALAKQGNVPKRIRTAYQRLLFLYHSAGNETKADNAAAELKKILDTTLNKNWKYEILVFLGNYHTERAEYEKSIANLLQSADIQKQLLKEGKGTDSSDIGITLLNIAKAYIDMQQPDKAIEYIIPSQPYFAKYISGQTYYHKNFIDAYLLKKQPSKALIYYDSLTTIVNTGEAGAFGWSDRMSADLAFAEYYLTSHNTDSALLFTAKANAVENSKKDSFIAAQINYMTGKVYAALKEYTKALPLLQASEAMTRSASLQIHASLLQTLAETYAATGQWQQASIYYAKYTPLRDSLYAEASKKSIADAEAKFQNKEKQQQIENKNLQLTAAKKQRLWLIAGISLVGLSAILLLIIYRNKKKTADLLNEKNITLAKLNTALEEANQTKAKLFSIIGHDLRSPISQVYQFLKLQQLNPNALNTEQKNELSNKIQTATGSLLETMEDLLLWSKTQMNEFKVALQQVLILDTVITCKNLLQLNSDAKNIQYNITIEKDNSVLTDPYYLQTIIRNLLQNAVKASPENGEINISTTENNNSLSLFIENKGGSFTQQNYQQLLSKEENATSLTGLGLRLVDELSQKINVSVNFSSVSPSSTRVEIILYKKH